MSEHIHISSDFEGGYETDQIVAKLIPVPGVQFIPYGFGEADEKAPKTIALWKERMGEGGPEPFRPSTDIRDTLLLLQTHFSSFALETFQGRHQVSIGTGKNGCFETHVTEEASSLEVAACRAAARVWLERHPELVKDNPTGKIIL